VSKIEVNIIGLSSSNTQTGSFALVLGEVSGDRRLPIIIGMFEAQSIALELEQIPARRPMTHDLFKAFAKSYLIDLTEVYISKLDSGVFYTEIHTKSGEKREVIDARPSDAIALALRFGVPIYTNEAVMAEAGIVVQDDDDEFLEEDEELTDEELDEVLEELEQSMDGDAYSGLSTKDLEMKLDTAIDNENYEEAAKLRDELDKRGK